MLFVLLNLTILVANIGSGNGRDWQLRDCSMAWVVEMRFRTGSSEYRRKERSPRNNVLIIGAVALTGAFLLSFERGAELLNFGAFIAFMGVNVVAFVRYYVKREEGKFRTYRPGARNHHLRVHLVVPEHASKNRGCDLACNWRDLRCHPDEGIPQRSSPV